MFNRLDTNICGNKKCCIVIPTHKATFDDNEMISIKKCFNIFSNKYDIFFIIPENIDITFNEFKYNTVKADKNYFSSMRAYNELCINTDFYKIFKDYEYMLIYQTDCFVFYDNLDYFCSLNYDYIGAPWPDIWTKSGNIVGNGGFSLRKIETFIKVFNDKKDDFIKYMDTPRTSWYYHVEDTYIGIKCKDLFKISDWKIAAEFSLECSPDYFMNQTKKLPMGCHAWYKNNFWKQYIKNPEN